MTSPNTPVLQFPGTIANRTFDAIIFFLGWIIIPLQMVTTFVIGVLVACSFGLLLLPLSLIWLLLLIPLLGISWLSSKVGILRDFVGIAGIPWTIVAHTYVCLMPSMGDIESRAAKLMITWSWPFSWECWCVQQGKLSLDSSEAAPLRDVLYRLSQSHPTMRHAVENLERQ
jgi:hypothetical protein